MKILLVQVPTSHLGAGERVYPLGLARLSSLVPESCEKEVLDMNLHGDPWPLLKELLSRFAPDVVAFSFRNIDPLGGHVVSYLSSLTTAAKMARRLLPHGRILAGGPAFSLFGERLMEMIPELDYGLIGEGEPVFQRLVATEAVDEADIPGLLWRRDGSVIVNPPAVGMAMESIPHLDTKAFSPASYMEGNRYVASMGVEGKRGCDLCCSYCLYPKLGNSLLRLRRPRDIVDDMEVLRKEHGIRLFHFTDPVLNRPPDHFEALCEELTRRKLDLAWTGFFREDTFTARAAGLARDAGLAAVYFSGDALHEKGLRLLAKRLTKDEILRASEITVSLDILTVCHFLVNLPYETAADVAEAKVMLENILDIHGDAGNLGAVIFNNIRLYPGATLTGKLLEDGLLDPAVDLLYPVYFDPSEGGHVRHEMEAFCHAAGVFSRLGMNWEKSGL